MKNIAVVILNWNGKNLLEQFLPSLLLYSPQATVYVADNASTDDSIVFVKNNFPTVTLINNNDNYGYAKGYNEALKKVKEPLYALVNSDVEVTENWLTPILNLYNKDPKTAIIQPKILDYNNKQKFEYAGAAGGFIDKYGYPYCRGRIFETIENDENQYNDTCNIFWASGACFFIRKEVFEKLNGFDNDFFAHQEEIDLCWRAFNLGHKITYCGTSTVYHVGGATLQMGSPRKTFLNFRNSLWMLTKNLPKNKLIPILFTRMLLDGIAALQFLGKGKPLHLWAIFKAHLDFYANFTKNLQKRNTIQNKNYYNIKSIVYRYYLKNGKVFDEIN